ncbi:MAG: glycosyltransferase family 39 protein [Planctomycetota bacterium]
MVLALLAVLAAVLRLRDYHSWEFWGDEVGTLEWSRKPVGEILGTYTFHMTMHLFVLIEKVIGSLLGESVQAFRLVPAACGIVTIPAVYLLARGFGTRVSALVAAAFAAGSSHLILQSQNARVYAASALVWILAGVVLVKAAHSLRWIWWVFWSALATAGMLFSLQGMPLFLAQSIGVALLLRISRKGWPALARLLVGGGIACGVSFLFYARLAGQFVAFAERDATYARTPFNLAWIGITWVELARPLPWVLLLLAVTGVILAIRRQRLALFLVAWWILPMVNPYLYGIHPQRSLDFLSRLLLPALPAAIVLAALALDHVRSRFAPLRSGSGSVGVVLLVGLLALWPDPEIRALLFKGPPYSRLPAALAEGQANETLIHGPSWGDESLAIIHPRLQWRSFGSIAAALWPEGPFRGERSFLPQFPSRFAIVTHVRTGVPLTMSGPLSVSVLGDEERAVEFAIVRGSAETTEELRQRFREFSRGFAGFVRP